jgi:hypothetical protein
MVKRSEGFPVSISINIVTGVTAWTTPGWSSKRRIQADSNARAMDDRRRMRNFDVRRSMSCTDDSIGCACAVIARDGRLAMHEYASACSIENRN